MADVAALQDVGVEVETALALGRVDAAAEIQAVITLAWKPLL